MGLRIFLLLISALCLSLQGAFAQNAPGGLGAKHDSSQPIEINADTLDVSQTEQTALFSGKVVAVQGEMRLGSDNLRLHYRGKEAQGEKAAISRLDAIGNVTVSSPSETAQGEWGVYDVDSGQITLGGNVVLTRGENVLRGEQLVIDLESGQSRITSKKEDGGRVKGLFIPSKKQKQ